MRKKLMEIRKKKKFTQQEIANCLNISRSTYSAYECGTINIPLDKALKLKNLLKYKNDDLFFNL